MHWPVPVFAVAVVAELTASIGNVCRAWRGGVQAAAGLVGDELGRREFPMACLADWLSHTNDQSIEVLCYRALECVGFGPRWDGLPADDPGRWWFKLAMCMYLLRPNASRRMTLKMLLDRAVCHPPLCHRPYAYRRHFFDMFQVVRGDGMFQMPMQLHFVRDLGCVRLGRSIHEVLWSTALCINGERPCDHDVSVRYCPTLCGCREDDLGMEE